MKVENILKQLREENCKKVKLGVTDLDGILRGKVVSFEKFVSALESGFGFCSVIFGWDCNDTCYEGVDIDFTGWHSGYPDTPAVIDPKTFRRIPWEKGRTPFFLADFRNKAGDALEICPRSLLKKIKSDAAGLGLKALFSQEFEWFNFKEEPNALADRNFDSPNPLTRGMFGYSILRSTQNQSFFEDLYDHMFDFDVCVEGIHTETGPGVYEVAIRYQDILEAADRAVLFKNSAKEIGSLHGIMPTFMAKYDNKLPGCSGHIHQSLWKDGKNIFHDESSNSKMSSEMESYIAGLLLCLPELLPMYAPTVNSYKRLVEGMWAPTTLTWGIDNRTTAVRAIPGGDKSSRIELRVPGSDVNPYLAMAAALASGLYGIKNKLKLETPQTMGNGYIDKKNGSLPSSLQDATAKMEQSVLAKELLGEQFVKHFTQSRRFEWQQFMNSVTDWELKRYFEVI